ncbi:MAG: hypothetical protein RR276_02315 [Angelakisella sp.]
MKNKTKNIYLLLVIILIIIISLFFAFRPAQDSYTYEDIPRQYVIGEIVSISENDYSIELLLDNDKPAFITMTINGTVKVYETTLENVKSVGFSTLKVGQTIQCDIRLGVTLEKINSFHDCRQIFILTEE